MNNLLVICVVVMLLGSTNHALAEKFVIVGCESSPFTMTEKGQVVGIHTDIVRELYNRNGHEADIQLVPWKRALTYVKDGTAAAIIDATRTEERTQFLYFPSEPLYIERIVIMGLKGTALKAAKLDDLKGKSVGVVRGFVYSPEFDAYEGMKKDESNDDVMLLKKLAGGRTDVVVGEETVLQHVGQQNGIQLETVCLLGEYPEYLAFSKASDAKGNVLAEQLVKTLRQLQEEGVIEKIRNNYLKAN